METREKYFEVTYNFVHNPQLSSLVRKPDRDKGRIVVAKPSRGVLTDQPVNGIGCRHLTGFRIMFTAMLLSTTLLFAGSESKYLDRIENLRTESGLFVDRLSDRSTISAAAAVLGRTANGWVSWKRLNEYSHMQL